MDFEPPAEIADRYADVRRDALAVIRAMVDRDEEGAQAIVASADHTELFFGVIGLFAEALYDTEGQLAGWVRARQAEMNRPIQT